MKLIQRKFFSRQEFTLNEDSLNVKLSNLTSAEEINIPYEEIDTSKISSRKEADNLMLLITVFMMIVFIVNLFSPQIEGDESKSGLKTFFFIVTFLCAVITYLKYKSVIFIPTSFNGQLELHTDNPTKDKFESFVKSLSKRIDDYLLVKYGTIDLDLPKEPQLANIAWLKERKIISQEQFVELKAQLKGKDATNNPVGFIK